MKRQWKERIAGLAVAGALVVSAVAALADDKAKDVDWENQFSGHEMWLTSLDDAIAKSTKEKKPLLIDFYSHT